MSSAPLDRAARIVALPSGYSTSGRVRRGPFAGKLLTVTIDPWHPINTSQPGWAHGDSRLLINDAETGKLLGDTDCGVPITECVAYGFYTWCVGGGAAGDGGIISLIAHTEDLINWRVINLGLHGTVNAFAVGPKIGALSPTGTTGLSGSFGGPNVPEEED